MSDKAAPVGCVRISGGISPAPSSRLASHAISSPAFFALALSGLVLCTPVTPSAAADKVLKVVVSAGPYGDILREAARLSENEGLKAEIIEFSDWNQPNAALQSGDIDLNNFQHRFYLTNQIKARGYKLVAFDESILVPAGIPSKNYTKASDDPLWSNRRSTWP